MLLLISVLQLAIFEYHLPKRGQMQILSYENEYHYHIISKGDNQNRNAIFICVWLIYSTKIKLSFLKISYCRTMQ